MSNNLMRFYDFFEKNDAERYHGIDENYFSSFNDFEKQEAWKFIAVNRKLSEEGIKCLYFLDKWNAVVFFKSSLLQPSVDFQYRAQRLNAERCKILMLKFILETCPERKYFLDILAFSNSEFDEVRAEFAELIPFRKIIPEVVEELKKMIFVETARAPLGAAIAKLMAIHGMDFDVDNPLYKSIYLALRSGSVSDKISAIKRLEKAHSPEYI